MPGPLELLALPVSRSTWRRVAHVVIGAVLATPYVLLSSFAVPALEGGLGAVGAWAVTIALYFVGLPIATGMLSPVRELEVGRMARPDR